jgi:hypothetical protein
MKEQCFTRDQAEMICYKYQYLTGKPYSTDKQNSWAIECVTVAPFDNLNKWLFIYTYEETDDPEGALFFYGSDQYDVILISRVNGEITFTDIRSYMAANHIKTDPLFSPIPDQINNNNFLVERKTGSWV